MLRAQRLELTDDRVMVAQLQAGIDSSLEGNEDELVEPGPFAIGELREGDLAERTAPAQRERLVEGLDRGRRVAAVEGAARAGDESFELHDVDVVSGKRQGVAGTGGHDRR